MSDHHHHYHHHHHHHYHHGAGNGPTQGPTAKVSRFPASEGPISLTPPEGYALSVLFKLEEQKSDPEDTLIYGYWVAAGHTAPSDGPVTAELIGEPDVLRVDVPRELIPEVGTRFFLDVIQGFHDGSQPPPTVIIH
jgi:hypothetical protein